MMSARILFRWVCATALAWLCMSGPAAAQLTPSMIADRPSQLYPVSTPGMVQLESGISYESSHHDEHLEHSSSAWLLAMLLRSGIFEGAELRIGFEYVNEAQHFGHLVERGKGLRNISIGTKVELMQEDGWVPSLSFFANAHLPFGQDDYRPHELIPGARLGRSVGVPAHTHRTRRNTQWLKAGMVRVGSPLPAVSLGSFSAPTTTPISGDASSGPRTSA